MPFVATERRPRNDDELFSDIVAREFHEQVNPHAAPPPPIEAPPPAPAPAPFEFNLYDDDESYRHVPGASLTRLSPIARVGLALLALSVVGGILLMMGAGAPRWVGWIVGLAFIGAAGIGIKKMLRPPGQDDDDSAVV